MKRIALNKIKITTLAALSLIVFGIAFTGCKKERRNSTMMVKMVDGPGDYQEVNVEVLRIEINHDYEGWIELDANPGIYDLLKLQNDISATISDQTSFPNGKIGQMRLILGSANTIMVDSVIYPLATPSAEQSGLKFKLDHEFKAKTDYELIIDFDVEKSIVEKGNGGYSLKPNIKVKAINEI